MEPANPFLILRNWLTCSSVFVQIMPIYYAHFQVLQCRYKDDFTPLLTPSFFCSFIILILYINWFLLNILYICQPMCNSSGICSTHVICTHPPLQKFQCNSILFFLKFAFSNPTHSLWISTDILWERYGSFLELYKFIWPVAFSSSSRKLSWS